MLKNFQRSSLMVFFAFNMTFSTHINAVTSEKFAKKPLQVATFDSGFGGYFTAHSIAQKARQLQQQHKLKHSIEVHHFGDTANAPYGEKTPDQIANFTSKGVINALNKGADYVFIACNTASTQYERVQQEVEKAFPNQKKSQKIFSIIDTSITQLKQYIDAALQKQDNVSILILSTPATMKSNTYIKGLAKIYRSNYQEIAQQELTENRWFNEKKSTIQSYFAKQMIPLSNKRTITVYQVSPANWVEMIEYGASMLEKEKNISFIFEEFNNFTKKIEPLNVVAEFCTHYPVIDSMIKKQLKAIKITQSKTPFILQGPLMAQIFAQKMKLIQLGSNNKEFTKDDFLDVTTDITISGKNLLATKNLVKTIFPSKKEIPVNIMQAQ